MTPLSITEPLRRAGRRTAELLWRPFDARVWFVLAFAQFLAALPPDTWGGGVPGGGGGGGDWQSATRSVGNAFEEILRGGLILTLVLVGASVLLVLLLLLLWIGSRAKFVFLDDVLTGDVRIVAPWNEYRSEGTSLFLFRIALFFSAVLAVGVVALLIASTVGLGAVFRGEGGSGVVALLALGLGGLLGLALGYTAFFLEAFVVPIMHRYRVGVVDAWRRFLELFQARPLPFLLLGLAVLAAFLIFGMLVLVFGVMTCCLGFLLLAIPYVSNVVLLPATVLYRAFTVEFLAQIDGDLLPTAAPPPAPAA